MATTMAMAMATTSVRHSKTPRKTKPFRLQVHALFGIVNLIFFYVATTTSATTTKGIDIKDGNDKDNNIGCRNFYLAPSTIPNAGWGVFAARDFIAGDTIVRECSQLFIVHYSFGRCYSRLF